MSIVAKGPAITRPEFRSDDEFNACLRLVRVYDIGTDGIIARLDVLMNAERKDSSGGMIIKGDQFNAAMFSSRKGDLLIPTGGVMEAVSFNVSSKDLAAALRGLADAVDSAQKQ